MICPNFSRVVVAEGGEQIQGVVENILIVIAIVIALACLILISNVCCWWATKRFGFLCTFLYQLVI